MSSADRERLGHYAAGVGGLSREFGCEFCGKVFDTARGRGLHFRNVHQDIAKQRGNGEPPVYVIQEQP